MKTKPRGIHATFETTCGCGGVLTVTNGRVDPHVCERLTGTLTDLYAALDRGA